jgi:class 3 adenylate cyclase
MKFCGHCGAQLPRATRAGGERRRVTLLFADVSGFTPMSEPLDPEDVYLLMNRCYERMGQVLEQHGGTVDKFIGDCIMALFGARVAHENDPERAVRAARAMQDELRKFNQELEADAKPVVQMKIGINLPKMPAPERVEPPPERCRKTPPTSNLSANPKPIPPDTQSRVTSARWILKVDKPI